MNDVVIKRQLTIGKAFNLYAENNLTYYSRRQALICYKSDRINGFFVV